MSIACTCSLGNTPRVQDGWDVSLNWNPEATRRFLEFHDHDDDRVNHQMAEMRLFMVLAVNCTGGQARRFLREYGWMYYLDVESLCMHHRVMSVRVRCPDC